MKKPTYEQAVQAIERAYEAGDLTAEEKAEKLQLAENIPSINAVELAIKRRDIKRKIRNSEGKIKEDLIKEYKKLTKNDIFLKQQENANKKYIPEKIELCKEAIADFKVRQKAAKAEAARKELIAKAETPEKKEEIKQLSDNEVLEKANPKPRIDVLSRQELQRIAEKNIQTRLANLPKKDKKEIPEEKIKEIANALYEQLDKLIDKILK